MKKLYILAALLMASTSAHAGGITFQINGERVRVESPRNCSGISCIKITSPGYTGTLGNIDLKGMGSKSKGDDDVVATAPAAPASAQATAPQPAAPAATAMTPPCCGEPRAARMMKLRPKRCWSRIDDAPRAATRGSRTRGPRHRWSGRRRRGRSAKRTS